jgi:glycosyltransferase involved in cell wall biosynthesis
MPGAMTGLRTFAGPFSMRLDGQKRWRETNMPTGSQYQSVNEGLSLHTMADQLMADPENIELAQRYYAAAVDAGRIQDAEKTFESILIQYPYQHPIRRLYVACCLKQEKYEMAMDAIEILVTFCKPDDQLLDSALQVRKIIGPKVISPEKLDAASLSLCMVVKNEQPFMAPCLSAVKSLVDEIILIDTGSTDRTADIARIFGAKVYDFKWNDDFSAARNYGLENASADWILVIDADEAIAQEDQLRLQSLVAEHQNLPTAFSLDTRNYTHIANTLNWQANNGQYPQHETGLGWFPSRKVRLFPNLAEVRFRYPVHELVDASVREAGLPIEDCSIPIHHYGHLNEKKNRRKAEHYFKMGYAKLQQLGDDVAALRELAVQAGQLEYWSESLELWHRLLAVRPQFIEAYVNMSGAYWQLGCYAEAVEAAQSALRINPGHKEAGYNYAVSLLLLGRAGEAASILNALCERVCNYLGAQFMLAASMVCAGDGAGGGGRLRQLAKTTKPAVLVMALRDLIKRMRNNHAGQYADRLNRAVTCLDAEYEMRIQAGAGDPG